MWESMGGTLVSDPIVVSAATGTLDTIGLGWKNHLCWKGFHNTWLNWQCSEDALESLPTPVVIGFDRTAVVG